jgi:hypothetical protein
MSTKTLCKGNSLTNAPSAGTAGTKSTARPSGTSGTKTI